MDSLLKHILTYDGNKRISQDSFAPPKVSIDEVSDMLNKLDRSKATGPDNLPARFENDTAEQLAPSIAHIINISIQVDKVLQDLKFSKVISLYKRGIKTDAGNYRPFSVLLYQRYYRVVCEQVYQFFQNKKLL